MNEGNPPPPHQSTIYLRNQNKRAESLILIIVCWILTLSIWIFIFMLIGIYSNDLPMKNDNFYKLFHFYPVKQKLKIIYLIVFLLLYLIYLIIEFTSPTFKFLCNKQKKKFHEKIKSIFQKIPSIILRSKSKNKKDENIHINDSQKFKIFSSRDVSGLFVLNTDGDNIGKKKYILLKLKEELILEDERTFSEYKKLKEDFIKENKRFDQDFQFEEEIKIIGLKDYYMIKLKDEDYFFINKIFFCILTAFTFVEIYKLYINYISVYQEFTIKKIISSYKKLDNEGKYDLYNPQINLITESYILPQSNYCHLYASNNKNNRNNIMSRNSLKNFSDKDSYKATDEFEIDENGGNYNDDHNPNNIPNPYANH